MNLTDPIADMLTRIRNANSANKATVSMPSSKKLVEIARVIYEEGYIEGYTVEDTEPAKTLTITLKYGPKKQKVINGIRRISKPVCASTPVWPTFPASAAVLVLPSFPPRAASCAIVTAVRRAWAARSSLTSGKRFGA